MMFMLLSAFFLLYCDWNVFVNTKDHFRDNFCEFCICVHDASDTKTFWSNHYTEEEKKT